MKKFTKPTTPKKARTSQPSRGETGKTKKHTTGIVKNNTTPTKQRVFKSQKITPTKDGNIKELFIRKNDTPKEKKHPEYGTSKLEERFAKNFLDKLGVKYQTQFKAESIGRYYDFKILPNGPIFEVNGGYWHGDERLYETKDLNNTQKKNKKVDKIKLKWALEHKISIYYFWEKDINENPEKILDEIRNILYIEEKKNEIKEKKKKRPNSK